MYSPAMKLMTPTLVVAESKDWKIVRNLSRFYVYDISGYCGFLPGWETPIDGLYKCTSFKKYFNSDKCFPFLIKVDEELAGFVLIDKKASTKDVDWKMGQFFVVRKFQKLGIGQKTAVQVFQMFPGSWEVSVIPENTGAIRFWKTIISSYSRGNFSEAERNVPRKGIRIVYNFTSFKN
jgi:predicted acetyltransferase